MSEKVVDDEKKVQDEKTDVKSPEPSPEADKQSLQKPEFTKEQEAEVTKRVSDALSQKGDKVRPLEDRIKVLETDNVKLKDKEFATEAGRFGLEVDKLKEAGITDSSKIETYANLFGKVAEKPKVIPKADSGETSGGEDIPQTAKGKMQAGWAEMHK